MVHCLEQHQYQIAPIVLREHFLSQAVKVANPVQEGLGKVLLENLVVLETVPKEHTEGRKVQQMQTYVFLVLWVHMHQQRVMLNAFHALEVLILLHLDLQHVKIVHLVLFQPT
jgi:hypothetical protein